MRFLLIALLLACGTSVHAQVLDDTSDFTVTFTVADTAAPSTSTLLSAVPISFDQIDLTWTPATDNVLVAGYVIVRDGMYVATTTLTSYSDTGLTASTTYSYAVQAFDLESNYSSSSNSLSTTTLQASVVSTSSNNSVTGTRVRLEVDGFKVTPGYSTTSLDMQVSIPARFEIRWGRTASYELGYIVTDYLTKDYKTLITELEPGTTYEYEIIAISQRGAEVVVDRGQFTTRSTIGPTPLSNVRSFSALPSSNDVSLEWDMTGVPEGSEIRIVRSPYEFPQFLQDGAIIYQGTDSSFLDIGILATYSPVYYTAFVIDQSGAVSSGAVAVAFKRSVSGQDRPSVTIPDTDHPDLDTATSTYNEPVQQSIPDMLLPDLSDIKLIQGAEVFAMGDESVVLDSSQALTISIASDTITPNIKSIIVTLTDPADVRKSFSFLLRINNDHTAYEAVLAPLGVAGESELVVEVYDFQTYVVSRYTNTATFEAPKDSSLVGADAFLYRLFSNPFFLSMLGLLLTLGILFWILLAKRRDDDEEINEGNSESAS